MEPNLEHVSLQPSPPNPNPNPNHHPFRAAKSTAFKREERRKRKERKRQERLALELAQWDPLAAPRQPATSPPPAPSDTPWPCDPHSLPDSAPSPWSWGPPAEPLPAPPRPPIAAAPPQAAAVRACRVFFAEDEDEEEVEGEGNAARFFEELFEKDAALREFYKAEQEKGEFLCLVCEGIGARAGKRFPSCSALVQHAGSVARTKRRLAHRSFAGAVGRLLGWGAAQTTVHSDNGGASESDDFDCLQRSEMETS